MLALTRKKDEAIVINGNIKIQILDIVDGKVRIGIDAPREMTIHREEVYLEIKARNQDSMQSNKAITHQLAQFIKEKKS